MRISAIIFFSCQLLMFNDQCQATHECWYRQMKLQIRETISESMQQQTRKPKRNSFFFLARKWRSWQGTLLLPGCSLCLTSSINNVLLQCQCILHSAAHPGLAVEFIACIYSQQPDYFTLCKNDHNRQSYNNETPTLIQKHNMIAEHNGKNKL